MQTNKELEEPIIIGSDDGLAEVLELAALAASSDAPVLITGETGTGKNLIAKTIHNRSAEKRGPFICVNCLCYPENPDEADPRVQGDFTNTTPGIRGLFETADGGTLFFDEIGETPPHLQGKLLGLIKDNKARRRGGEFEGSVSVRIMASSNADLEKAVGGAFRKDLYYRLNAIRIHIPPLRERRRDIPALCGHLLRELAERPDVMLPDSELQKLVEYYWPGNVRELKNVLERAVILQKGPELRPSEFLTKTGEQEQVPQQTVATRPPGEDRIMTVGEIEKNQIELALLRFSGNRTKAAEALGISLSTIKRRIRDMANLMRS